MKDDRKVREALAKIGTLAGVGEDWYEIGEAEYDDVADDNVRYGVYAKSDEIADKVGKVLDKLMADRKTEPQYDIDKGTIKCDNCSENGSYKCSKCDGEIYFKRLEVEDEPQTDCSWK